MIIKENLKKKNVFKILKAIFVFCLFYSRLYIQYLIVAVGNLNTQKMSNTDKILLSLAASVIVAVIFIIMYRKELVDNFKKFKNNLLENADTAIKYWFLGLTIMIVSNLVLNIFFSAGGANNEHAVQAMIDISPWVMLFYAAVIAPFTEEFVFRKALRDLVNNKWAFVLLSAVIFGAAHVVSSASCFTDYLFIIPYGALGAAFALTYYETDTIFSSITMHMFHNAILVMISMLIH